MPEQCPGPSAAPDAADAAHLLHAAVIQPLRPGDEADPQGQAVALREKLHVGTDRRGLVRSVATGPASQGDINRLDDPMHGQERELFGDQARWSEDHRQHCRHAGIAYRVNRRAKPGRTLTDHEKAISRSGSRHRARGEHRFARNATGKSAYTFC